MKLNWKGCMMENRTESEIIHDMEGIILTRARKAELNVIRYGGESNICIWNEYKVLLNRLNLEEEYIELYG